MTFCSKKVDDLLPKATDLYHLSIKRTEGEGRRGRFPPLPIMTTKVKNTPRKIGLINVVIGLQRKLIFI